jgi:glycosyltransferase involved in cell wall biosynthesis
MSTNTTDMPLVTVIIPTYNSARYIVETVESVLMQTYANMEIVIIDDGSQDHTDKALAPLMPQITYVYQENQGSPSARNHGIQIAKGEYICFLDADDYWITADKVEKQVAILQADPSLDYVHSGWYDVNVAGEILNTTAIWAKAPNLTLYDWLHYSPIRLQSFMVKRQCLQDIGGFNTNYPVAQDAELFFNIASKGYKGTWLQEITTAYRIHPDSISHRKRIEQTTKVIEASTSRRK